MSPFAITPLSLHFALTILVGCVLMAGCAGLANHRALRDRPVWTIVIGAAAAVAMFLSFNAVPMAHRLFSLGMFGLAVALYGVPFLLKSRLVGEGRLPPSHASSAVPASTEVAPLQVSDQASPTLVRVRFLSFATLLGVYFATFAALNFESETDYTRHEEEDALREEISKFADVPFSPYRTDRGYHVHVKFHNGTSANVVDADLREFQKRLLAEHGLSESVVIESKGWLPCNCHGYIFTGGKHWVLNSEVPAILVDNGYRPISKPRVGDLAIYRDGDQRIVHSGMVHEVTPDRILVESKWGKLGCFVHPHHVFMQANLSCEFRRSGRDGHLLRVDAEPGQAKTAVANVHSEK